MLSDLVQAARQLDAAALTATARVNLRFDNPDVATELLGGLDRVVDSECGQTLPDGDAVLGEELFRLILVNLHSRFDL